jgi:hypothetical protein
LVPPQGEIVCGEFTHPSFDAGKVKVSTTMQGRIEWSYLNSTRTGWHARVELPTSRDWMRSISSHPARFGAPQ